MSNGTIPVSMRTIPQLWELNDLRIAHEMRVHDLIYTLSSAAMYMSTPMHVDGASGSTAA